MSNSLEQLKFDNGFVKHLPADPVAENAIRTVNGACYSFVLPRKTNKPELLIYSPEVAELLGVEITDCQSELFKNIFTGNQLLTGMSPYATCYGGHQFGQWAGQLGDGRAINLGEIIHQQKRWSLQLKGAGPTPYSRHADGLAVLRSSLREFLCSEAMFHLGVPTTRALSLCLTGDRVKRDMFYDGHPKDELGAVVCRVAPSFTRFGHLQILAAQGNTELLKAFLDFTIRTDFPHLGKPSNDVYYQWFNEVCQLTRIMVVDWMRVGFVHGVMNTDNMSVLGLTIDYGPYGWLEGFDLGWTPNTTDSEGKRYCFGRQPSMAHWNLAQLAQTISSVVENVAPLQQALEQFCDDYQSEWQVMMLNKLGLGEIEHQEDHKLLTQLLEILQLTETDMTIFYRKLADLDVIAIANNGLDGLPEILEDAFYQLTAISDDVSLQIQRWLQNYAKRALLEENLRSKEVRKKCMNRINPKYVLRNYLAQQAIEKSEQGDHSMLKKLLDVMRLPYEEQADKEIFASKRPEWARHKAGCSMLSCSS